ncbi:MAG: hypothetical protein AAFR53_06275 [Pseudomonadota bacterium]
MSARIRIEPYTDARAFDVLRWLDHDDYLEASLVRGQPPQALALFSEWRALEPLRLASYVLTTDCEINPRPFAVLGVSLSGMAGVAQAALLAKSHTTYRRQLVTAAREIRAQLPLICAEKAINRIEARCWAHHPTAPRFLAACDFHLEAKLPGFGVEGAVPFLQFAYLPPAPKGS